MSTATTTTKGWLLVCSPERARTTEVVTTKCCFAANYRSGACCPFEACILSIVMTRLAFTSWKSAMENISFLTSSFLQNMTKQAHPSANSVASWSQRANPVTEAVNKVKIFQENVRVQCHVGLSNTLSYMCIQKNSENMLSFVMCLDTLSIKGGKTGFSIPSALFYLFLSFWELSLDISCQLCRDSSFWSRIWFNVTKRL